MCVGRAGARLPELHRQRPGEFDPPSRRRVHARAVRALLRRPRCGPQGPAPGRDDRGSLVAGLGGGRERSRAGPRDDRPAVAARSGRFLRVSLPGRLLDLAPARLFVHRSGQGAPLVLLHGFLVSHWYFRPVIAPLAERFEVIALDLPGHGESDNPPPDRFGYDFPAMADLVVAALDALGVGKVRLYGHSMGGGIALTLAARHPDRVERLLLEDPAVYPLPISLEGRLALLPGIGPFLFKNVYRRSDLRKHLRNAYRDPTLGTEELIDYFWERFNRAGARAAYYATLKYLGSLADNTGDPGRITAPTLIAWGEEDRIIPLAHGKRLARQIPGARLEVIPACGHSPHEERPDELLRVALPFLLGEDGAGPQVVGPSA
ncbi:MAG: alpha/beta fold hydrolase [Myxococcales bacterium]|nr:alpha/beta fold hydrolase [Myxococcales bacterium]